jgi:hypothetical protein
MYHIAARVVMRRADCEHVMPQHIQANSPVVKILSHILFFFLLLKGVAAHQRGACAGSPQRLRSVPPMRRRRSLLQAILILMLQDGSPNKQQVLLRVVTHEQSCIQKEVPAQGTA